jgi:hypothetical protein
VIIAAQWPSWLVALNALEIPIQAAYFPADYHIYFKINNSDYAWKSPLDVLRAPFNDDAIYLLSGDVQFARKLRSYFAGQRAQRLILSLETHFRGTSRSSLTSARTEGLELLHSMDLKVVIFADRDCGGATDAVHRFGFGRDIESSTLPSPELGLPLCVRHFLNGGTELSPNHSYSFVPRASVKSVEDSQRKVRWVGGILRPDGLLPRNNPLAMTYCPVYSSPHSWVVRPLSLSELLRIYQLPQDMDPLFTRHLDLSSGFVERAKARITRELLLPFENSPSSAILTSIIRQLWGDDGGGEVLQPVAEAGLDESHNCQGAREEREGEDEWLEVVSMKEGGLGEHTAGVMTVTRPDTPRCDSPATSTIREEDTSVLAGNRLPSWAVAGQPSDDDSLTSLASEDTVRWHNVKYPEWDKEDPELEMERGAPLQYNRAPPSPSVTLYFVTRKDVAAWQEAL